MKVTQGQFSFLPDLSEAQIAKQVQYALDHGWPISLEYTDDPHPRNTYWEMHGLPMFDVKDAAGIMESVREAISAHPSDYVKLNAYDASRGRQTTAMSFIIHRPKNETGFRLERTVGSDRQVSYKIHAYATDEPSGDRYGG